MDDHSRLVVGRHFAGTLTRMVIDHLDKHIGNESIESWLARTGETRTLAELRDDSAWSSYAQFRSLLEATAVALGGVERLRDIGRDAAVAAGSMVITELYKTGSPQFRYNIMDLSYLYPKGQCACGSWLRKIGPFAGRGDNMVKLRGINIWPEAVGDVATSVDGADPDYFVRAVRVDGRDELIVSVTSSHRGDAATDLRHTIEQLLHDRLGVRIAAEIVEPGALDAWTEVLTSPKPKRFRDERS